MLLLMLGAAHELNIWVGQCIFALAALVLWINTPAASTLAETEDRQEEQHVPQLDEERTANTDFKINQHVDDTAFVLEGDRKLVEICFVEFCFGEADGATVRERFTHVVKHQVRVRPDELP